VRCVAQWISSVLPEFKSRRSFIMDSSVAAEVELVSGDRLVEATRVAQEVGVHLVRAAQTPEAKTERVVELKRQGRRVAFLGDGINDAPALAEADLGVAVGSGYLQRHVARAVIMSAMLAAAAEVLLADQAVEIDTIQKPVELRTGHAVLNTDRP